MTPARLHLFGGFRLTTGQGRAVDVSAKKNRALIGILALAPQGEVTRERLTGLLWSDRGEEQARSSLRQALVALRKDFSALDADPLVLNGDRIAFAPELLTIDVVEFLSNSTSADPSNLQRAAELYSGAFLDGLSVADNVFDEWLREARADLASRATKILATLAEKLAGADRVVVAEKLVALDPLREASHLTLMQAHIAQGQSALAIRQYESCKLVLNRELGVEPGAELQALRRSLDMDSAKPGVSLNRDRKPVIAVLPFENLSGDPSQQYFSDGITEDIIDRLTKYRILSVIGRHSSFALHGSQGEIRNVRDKLTADYVLTGSIRKSADRIRIAARLTDARTEAAMWADHYDRPLQDIFAVQDEVASIIASTLTGRLEIDVVTRSPTPSPNGISSYEYLLQGIWHFKKLTPASNAKAVACFEKAIAAYPENADAHRWLAGCHVDAWLMNFAKQDLVDGLRTAARAMELDPASAVCHSVNGLCKLWMEGVEAASVSYQKALSLNPGDPNVLIEVGLLNVYAGSLAVSRNFFDQAFRLNPLPPLWYQEFRAVGAFVEGLYAEAMPAFAAIPDYAYDNMYTMACAGHLHDRKQAASCISRIQEIGRSWNLLESAASEPYLDPEPRERLIAGLEKALAF